MYDIAYEGVIGTRGQNAFSPLDGIALRQVRTQEAVVEPGGLIIPYHAVDTATFACRSEEAPDPVDTNCN